MTRRRNPAAERAKLALELTMRDALDGLEEWVSLDLYRFETGCFEILSIERPVQAHASPTPHHSVSAKILNFDTNVPTLRRRAG